MGRIGIRMFKAPGKWEGFAHAGFLLFVDALYQLIQLSCLGLGDDAIHFHVVPFPGEQIETQLDVDDFLCVITSWEGLRTT